VSWCDFLGLLEAEQANPVPETLCFGANLKFHWNVATFHRDIELELPILLYYSILGFLRCRTAGTDFLPPFTRLIKASEIN
jgi:hypothetical protein